MTERSAQPNKKDVAETLLNKGNVFLHLDPRKKEVIVPKWLKDQLQLVLQIGYDLPIPIPDLFIDDSGVSATLSFNRSPFACYVPWNSLFALVGDDGRGMVWMSEMPAELAAEIEREARRHKSIKPESAVPSEGRNALDVKDSTSSSNGARSQKAKSDDERELLPQPSDGKSTIDLEETSSDLPSISHLPRTRAKKKSRSSRPSAKRPSRKPRELPPYLRVVK
jgi:hypothetical protein